MTTKDQTRLLGAVRTASASLYLLAGVLRDRDMRSVADSADGEAEALLDLYGEITKTGPYEE